MIVEPSSEDQCTRKSIAYLWGKIVTCHYEDSVNPYNTCKTEKCLYFGPNIVKHWKYMEVFTQSPIFERHIPDHTSVNCYRLNF